MNKFESKYFNTAKKMDDALISLLQEKDFDYITVKDICSKAKVSRSTFYLHYMGTYDLLEEVIKETNKSFKKVFNTLDLNINNINSTDELFLITDEYLIPYLNFIKENRKVYKAIHVNPELFYVDQSYKKLFDNYFSPILSKYNVDIKEHNYIMQYYLKGIGGLVINWVINDCKEEVSFISYLIKKCVNVK